MNVNPRAGCHTNVKFEEVLIGQMVTQRPVGVLAEKIKDRVEDSIPPAGLLRANYSTSISDWESRSKGRWFAQDRCLLESKRQLDQSGFIPRATEK
jgi:hypothetical protein